MAAYFIDTCKPVDAFVKNAGLGFAIPYLHNGQVHDYVPDFIIRLKGNAGHLILETKGYDELTEVKAQAARRWVAAVNADGRYGRLHYAIVRKPAEIPEIIRKVVIASGGSPVEVQATSAKDKKSIIDRILNLIGRVKQ